MLEITDSELEALIEKYKNPQMTNPPALDLKELVKYGLMYSYGQSHYKDGKVATCTSPFTIYSKHKCHTQNTPTSSEIVLPKSKFLQIKEVSRLTSAPDCIYSCWTGYNLALLTSAGVMQGYFKKELLFEKTVKKSCIVVASADKIYLGTTDGDIVYFDPINQSIQERHCHTDRVNSMRISDGILLSTSASGTVFYKKQFKVSNFGVIDAYLTGMNRFVCACEDKSVVVIENDKKILSYNHESRIRSLSFQRIAISSSDDGEFVFLKNDGSYERKNIGCSIHKQVENMKILGYGIDKIVFDDLNRIGEGFTFLENTKSCDYSNNIIAWAADTYIKFRDVRTNAVMHFNLKVPVKSVNFSDNGDLLFVNTNASPYVLSLKAL